MQGDGYKVQSTITAGPIIQAKKARILRHIITADRCFTIAISGASNDFTVKIGIGKWIQNIAVASQASNHLKSYKKPSGKNFYIECGNELPPKSKFAIIGTKQP